MICNLNIIGRNVSFKCCRDSQIRNIGFVWIRTCSKFIYVLKIREDSLDLWKQVKSFENWLDLWAMIQNESLKVRFRDQLFKTTPWIWDTNPRVHNSLIRFPQPHKTINMKIFEPIKFFFLWKTDCKDMKNMMLIKAVKSSFHVISFPTEINKSCLLFFLIFHVDIFLLIGQGLKKLGSFFIMRRKLDFTSF
jgi:hypothetical protein